MPKRGDSDLSRFADIGLDNFAFEPMEGEQPDGSIQVERGPAWERFVNDGLEHMTVTPPEGTAPRSRFEGPSPRVVYTDTDGHHWNGRHVRGYDRDGKQMILYANRGMRFAFAHESHTDEPDTWHRADD
jgi:hypothetical protein